MQDVVIQMVRSEVLFTPGGGFLLVCEQRRQYHDIVFAERNMILVCKSVVGMVLVGMRRASAECLKLRWVLMTEW